MIEASAPTRIDLAGGTIDIWPLYLFHEHAQTLNAAITIRAHCTLGSRADRRIVIRSEDTGQAVEVDHWSALREGADLRLLGCILHFFRVQGLELVTRSESPVGAGIAGSSALNIAVCGALSRWTGRDYDHATLLQVAMNVEAQAIDVPTGVQDYRPALYGGLAAIELAVDGIHRVPLPVDPADFESHVVLAYTGASRNSGINNWEVTKRHIDGDKEVFDCFERIRDIAVAMREALAGPDWTAIGRLVAAEWAHRQRLAPGVTTPAINGLIDRAMHAGAMAAKVCGAGGGGCLFCVTDPRSREAVRQALAGGGAQVLDYHVDLEGLVVTDTGGAWQ